MQLNVNISDEAYQVAKKTAKAQGHFLSKWIEQAILSYGKPTADTPKVEVWPEPSHDLVVKQKGKRPRKITVREQKAAIAGMRPKINIAKLLP